MILTLLFSVIFLIILSLFLLSLFLFWRLWFCRKPKRRIPEGAKNIISPANGTVEVIKKFSSPTVKAKKWNTGSVEFMAQDVAKKGWFILIVMTPLNVHYQRAPFTGKVLGTHYSKGKFHNAVKDPARLLTLENERNEILFETKHGKMKIVQIAGALARRINCFVEKDQKVQKGEEVGFINLGSQVAMLLPENVEIKVKNGQTVIDGETIIGAFK